MGSLEGRVELARRTLNALADLSPTNEDRSAGLTIPTEWFRWLPLASLPLFSMGHLNVLAEAVGAGKGANGYTTRPAALDGRPLQVAIDRTFAERLAAVDQIRPAQRSLRAGWLFVAGTVSMGDGPPRRVFHPLVTVPVKVVRGTAVSHLVTAGDVELTDLVTDVEARRTLERAVELGGGALDGGRVEADPAMLDRLTRLQRFVNAVVESAGLPPSRLVPVSQGPDDHVKSTQLTVVAGVAVYAVHRTGGSSRAGSLRSWADGELARETAFHDIYLDDLVAEVESAAKARRRGREEASVGGDRYEQAKSVGEVGDTGSTPVWSPFVLTPIQRQAVHRSRTAPVTTVSGAPGTGKSQTVVAIACDALARGESVLLAAKSDAGVDALLDLLERAPGPEPVVFGSSERREALATRLAAGTVAAAADMTVRVARQRLDDTIARRERLAIAIAAKLTAEQYLATDDDEFGAARVVTPRLFEAVGPIDATIRVDVLLNLLRETGGGGWWRRRRHRRARQELDELIGSVEQDVRDIEAAVPLARAWRAVVALIEAGGLDLTAEWAELTRLDDELRVRSATWLGAECRSSDRVNRSTLPAVAALATALRSGRAARRAQLNRLDAKLTKALPLWVGTLPDIDDLLPAVPQLFDLVVLDEASSIDQPLAAPALLRARRAVVVGDPQQLRHVSFLADDRIAEAVDAQGLDQEPLLAARLDVRRNSAFDVAAGVAPVLMLDEHFRSNPHLVDFVARRLYGDRLQVATRSPATESKDCVELIRLDGHRNAAGVVEAEVLRTVHELRRLRSAGVSSVGVVTPFRAQAEALEAGVLAAFHADDLEALDLRVGTVHAFQGNERDVIVASFGLGPDDVRSWRFVDDPHLLAVFLTRARLRMILLLSADAPDGSLIGDYLAQVDSPPSRPRCGAGRAGGGGARFDGWVQTITDGLAGAGIEVSPDYPCGRHVIDVCAGNSSRFAAVECDVHPAGAEAHIERHLALVRAGWDVVEAHRSRWADRPGELVVDLLAHYHD